MDENNTPKRPVFEFTSEMTPRERLAALIYLPVHFVILPVAASVLLIKFYGELSESTVTLGYYALGVALMLLFEWKFLRREFDTLCDRPFRCLFTVFIGYGLMLTMNYLVADVLYMFIGDAAATMSLDNPNNNAIFEVLDEQYGLTAATTIFLAPILEEILFRGGLFGTLRHRNRLVAYLVTVFLFSLYHVWQSALLDWHNLIFLIQYVPVTCVLCWAYERTDTIWTPIFLHMFINFMSLKALEYLESVL